MTKRILIAILALVLASTNAYSQKIKLIIDAGHGGKDVGAKNKAGDKESDLCLIMAEVLQKYAQENGMETVMTRTKKEQTLTHEQRSGYKADKNYKYYYISLHMDKDKKASTRGNKLYYCSKAVGSGVGLKLAERIGKGLEKLNGNKSNIEDKDAIILKRNTVPSVMVYYGHVTNPQDVKLAKDPAYQREVCMLIIRSIMETRY
jgi:N-acetylmuramoyl-L-alanine amidase